MPISIHWMVSSHLVNSHLVNSHFVNFTSSIPTLSTSHFVNSHFVNIDQVGIDKVRNWQSGNWQSRNLYTKYCIARVHIVWQTWVVRLRAQLQGMCTHCQGGTLRRRVSNFSELAEWEISIYYSELKQKCPVHSLSWTIFSAILKTPSWLDAQLEKG